MGLKEHVRPYYLKWLYFRLFPEKRPPYFSDCWNYPAGESGGAGTAPDFVFLPMTDWHTRLQRSQHLALALARSGHQCSYLNPHLGREFPLPTLVNRGPVIASLAPGVREIHVHLAAEPVFHHRMLSSAESRFITKAIGRALPEDRPAVQVVSFPLWLDAARRLRDRRGWPIVYDCHDLLSGFRGIGADILAAEADLFRASDLVVFSSRLLKEKWEAALPEVAGRSLLIPNAVTAEWVAAGAAAGQSRVAQKTVGYAGALDYWFDTEAVKAAALRHPEWRFVLIGRIEHDGVRALEPLVNIELLGEIAHARLPEYLARFDAAMIPFQVNDLTRCADPIKLYEYFSFGLPVVSSALPEVEPFQPSVYISKGTDEFVAALETAMAESDSGRRAERKRIAAGETWDRRAGSLIGAWKVRLRRAGNRASPSASI